MHRSSLGASIALAAIAAGTPARAEESVAATFLRKTVAFTDAQIAAVDAGQVVTKQLPAADPPEIAAFGAVRLRGDAAAFLRQLGDGVDSRRSGSIVEMGR